MARARIGADRVMVPGWGRAGRAVRAGVSAAVESWRRGARHRCVVVSRSPDRRGASATRSCDRTPGRPLGVGDPVRSLAARSLAVAAGVWGTASLGCPGGGSCGLHRPPVGAVMARTCPDVSAPGRKTVFVCSLVFYLLIGFQSLGVAGLGGDEPHYLVIAHSLLVDRDLKIENNHARGDYRAFFGGPLKPDYLRRGLNQEIYSIHAPGLPVLLLPAYALAGVQGAVAMMCLFAALATVAVFDLAGLIGGTRAAWATCAGTCLTIPFVPHAWAIYPEMAGAAIVAWALVWCCGEQAREFRAMALAGCVSGGAAVAAHEVRGVPAPR